MSIPKPLELPAYLIGGPKSGMTYPVHAHPWTLQFPVPIDYTQMIKPVDNPLELHYAVDEYEIVRSVMLYRYRGRF